MVYDHIKNAAVYNGLDKGVSRALAFLQNTDFSQLADGHVDIDGEHVYATLSSYETMPRAHDAEAHQKYMDIQYVLEGRELVGVGFTPQLRQTVPYDPVRDIAFYEAPSVSLPLFPGQFLLLYPWDAHAPAIAAEEPAPVRKVVVKVLYEE